MWCIIQPTLSPLTKIHKIAKGFHLLIRILKMKIFLFGVFFPIKTCFPIEEFSNEMFWKFLYIVFIVAPICHFSFAIKFKEIWILEMHIFCQILCFILKICDNFKSYQNMLTLSSLIFNVISYKFSLNNIYNASHLHVKKGSWTFSKT